MTVAMSTELNALVTTLLFTGRPIDLCVAVLNTHLAQESRKIIEFLFVFF